MTWKRMLSALLCVALVLTGMPLAAFAESLEDTQAAQTDPPDASQPLESNSEPVEETTAPTEATTAPTEATTAPTEATTAPTEATTVPTEATTAPTEATTAPTEETTIPTEATTAPTEETTAPTEETTVPTEATTAPTEETTAPTEETTVPTEETTAPVQEPAAPTQAQLVQAMIDALPEAGSITAENAQAVRQQLAAIDEAVALATEPLDGVDVTRYYLALEALSALESQTAGVAYIDEAGMTQTCADAEPLTADRTALDWGWYVVSGSLTMAAQIEVTGEVGLILCDNSSLFVSSGIRVLAGGRLTVYSQSLGANMGILSAGQSSGPITVNGGFVAICAPEGEVTVHNGDVDVIPPVEEPTQPSEEATDPTEESTQPSGEATDPTEESTQPGGEATDPTEESTQPGEEATDPTEESTQPSGEATDPTEESTEPSEETTEPSGEATDPTEESTEPTEESTQPTEESTEPTEPVTAEQVQAMIDALPDADTITAENAEEVKAQLAAIDTAKVELSDEELDSLDITRYMAAVDALSTLEGWGGENGPDMLGTGAFTVTGGTEGTDYKYKSNTLTILTGQALTISTNGTRTTTDKINVSAGVQANIMLNNVNIDVSGTYQACALDLSTGGNCVVTLVGRNILKSGNDRPGMWTSNTVTIQGTGELEARGGRSWPGIGGNSDGGTILIKGGTIKAYGGDNGAGIGGSNGFTGGTITITDGAVTAEGGYLASGIGGGAGKASGTINISGGTVYATGGDWASGIGGGYKGTSGTINISGGTVYATGGDWASGIGGGEGASCGTVNISGGVVTAVGGCNTVGIGGGDEGAGGTVTITGGTVTATGRDGAAGIGDDNGNKTGSTGTFSTGNNGNAFIDTNGITDQSGKTNWHGAIIENSSGQIYGTAVTLGQSATIPSGKTLTVPEGTTLTVGPGTTLTNSGTIYANGTLNYGGTTYGTLTGNGTFNFGDFKVTGDVSKVSYASNTLTVQNGADVTITMKDGITTTKNDRILVAPSATASITLAGVNIDMGDKSGATAFMIEGSNANVTLTLAAGTTNTLKSGESCPGLGVKKGSTVTIRGDGALESTGGSEGAGIGGGHTYNAGTINIQSGTITAKGGFDGAGIGGGHSNDSQGNQYGLFDNIHITGGVINAHSPGNAAAIGTGCWAKTCPGSITIENAQVTAKTDNPTSAAPNRCAAIGRALSKDSGNYDCAVTIKNSIVSAQNVANRGNTISGTGGTPDIQNSIVKVNAGSSHDNAYAVYGSHTLSASWTVPTGTTLFIDSGSSLTVGSGATLTTSGTIYVDGTLTGSVAGSVYYPLTVTGGEASPIVTQNSKTYGLSGDTITLTAEEKVGQTVSWISSEVTVANDNTFTMPANAVTVTAQYENAPTYIVTIPASLTMEGTATIRASNVNVAQGDTLEVVLDTANVFTMTSGEGATLTYEVRKDGVNGAKLNPGDCVLRIPGGTANATGKVTLGFVRTLSEVERYSGTYRGSATFIVKVVTAP